MTVPQSSSMQVRVAVFAPLWTSFDYLWPTQLLGTPERGLRVTVPFGFGKREGVILEVLEHSTQEQELKSILDRLDIHPLLDEPRQLWLSRMAAYNLCTTGEIYETALAWAGQDKQRRFRCQHIEALQDFDADLSQAFRSKRAFSLSTLMKHCKKPAVQWRVCKALQQGLIEEVVQPQAAPAMSRQEPLTLRGGQQKAVDAVLANPHFFPVLLFGRTGSGKTEVYLQIAEALVKQGKQALILVPEIGLTPMWQRRLQARFERVSIWHSGLSAREKIAVRHALKDTQVLLGTRSALFLPLPRLGFIAMDEEHDISFKQQDGVMYSARDMSLLLAQELDIPIVLGSATPSLESWRQVQEQHMTCFRLHERVHQHTQVVPEIIDMRGLHTVLSPPLIQHLQETFRRGEQAMLYLNRRGYAPALQCTACGYVPMCKSCSLRLTLHRKQGILRCHTCDYTQRIAQVCPKCGEKAFLPLGAGTERLEDDLRQAVPGLKVARFDRDMIRHAKDLQQTLAAFEAGDIDCLVGTQMLVKGHHFPNVTLVGVVNADLGMHLPDFRASERWWQQMTQVFGRTGRGAVAGKVVVQTFSPDAPWFKRLDEAKAEQVLDEELSLRKLTHFPPYARWVRIVFSAVNHEKAIAAAHRFAQALKTWDKVKVSGPMPCALERVAGRFRFELIARDESRKHLPWQLQPLLENLKVPPGVRRKVDVDPQDFM